ncbi:histidinol-phosphate transaminase [Thiomicrorhabdus sediminis]|uniref:Histidinol-phosphate aminotransferase n=1 Tax=Thiomicrorhabdus sediminis TaxID=2580412 RepID=A0A4P9K6U3_9GAMM|nr:histidinol-phosphate transaminase [Thiomicrorhabdus sediminis]QCU90618.1 histidinol-phosphate transaminase [Thiomicrorhabdus sediminis]
MSQFWSELVHNLDPYVPGEQPKVNNLIKLNTNENPYPPADSVLEAIRNATDDKLKLYPDPNADLLKQRIADYFSVQRNQVFVGNGSDEVLAHAFQALLKKDKPLLFPDITYSFYPVYCGLYGIDFQTIPLDEDFAINVNDYGDQGGAIIFPNPNAPTGRLLTLKEIEKLLINNQDKVVVVDEAYIDFGGQSAISLVNQYHNLLVIQTLSKSRSLAGLRVGYAIGHADLIDGLERVKNSFNSYPMDRLAIYGAVASFDNEEAFQQSCRAIINTRETLTDKLQSLGFKVIPSTANFVFASHPDFSAEQIAQKLREKAIIVRYFNKPRINEFLRITIGNNDENAALCTALSEIITS